MRKAYRFPLVFLLFLLPVVSTAQDTDGDGVPNSVDLDDDNDGVLDEQECRRETCGDPIINGGFEHPIFLTGNAFRTNDQVDGWFTDAPDGLIEMWSDGFLGVPAFEGNQFVELNAHFSSALYQELCITPGTTLEWSFRHRGREGIDEMQVRIGVDLATAVVQETMSSNNTAWEPYSGSYTVPMDQTTTFFVFEAVSTAGGNIASGNFIDAIQINVVSSPPCRDSDNDGVSDNLDLDRDNDGIYDIHEAENGNLDLDFDGMIDPINGSIGTNGIFDSIETFPDSGIIAVQYMEPDTDMDGLHNGSDLDSDNDGCPDFQESGGEFPNGGGTLGINPDGTITGYPGVYDGINGNEYEAVEYTLITPLPSETPITAQGDPVSIAIALSAESTTTFNGRNPQYDTSGNANNGIRYQWYLGDPNAGGTAIPNRGIYSGTDTATLDISDTTGLDGNQYCVSSTHVDNDCLRDVSCTTLAVNDPCDPITSGNPDTDGDGVADLCDLDDDNDGILDTEELLCGSVKASINAAQSTWQSAGIRLNANESYMIAITGSNRPEVIAEDGPLQGRSFFPILLDAIRASGPLGNIYSIDEDRATLRDPFIVSEDIPAANLDAEDYEALLTFVGMIDVNDNGEFDAGDEIVNLSNLLYNNQILSAPASGNLFIVYTDRVYGDNSGRTEFTISEADCDMDGDGLPNSLDLDSDNDGCPDVRESDGGPNGFDRLNGTGVDGDGRVTGHNGGYDGANGSEYDALRLIIDTPPIDQSSEAGGTAEFTVMATAQSTTSYTGTVPDYDNGTVANAGIQYQWHIGNPIASGTPVPSTGIYSGTNTATLNISDTTGLSNTEYCVQVTHTDNPCIREIRCARLIINTDCDDDGIPDDQELDSNNDGIPDECENCDPLPVVDQLSDVEACEFFELPELSSGEYFTGTYGSGSSLQAGDIIMESQTLYVYTGESDCSDESSFTITILREPTLDLPETINLCLDSQNETDSVSIGTDLGPGYVYDWFPDNDTNGDGMEEAILTTGTPGLYTLKVYQQGETILCGGNEEHQIQVTEFIPPTEIRTNIEFSSHLLNSENRITVIVDGSEDSNDVFEYSLDDPEGPYSSENVFRNISPGVHTAYVRGNGGCGKAVASEPFLLVNYPNVFTPNGDGINDTWNVLGADVPESVAQVSITIFDRYGKLLAVLSPNDPGWDGTFDSASLPASDYWFSVQYMDTFTGREVAFKGHFSLLR